MKLHDSSRRIQLAALVAGVAGIVLLPTSAPGFAGGDGSPESPYLVATAADLNDVRSNLAAHYRQTAPIDLGVPPWNTDAGWQPIGTTTEPFAGSYQGGGFMIENLTIQRPAESGVGLFGVASAGASLSEVRLVSVQVAGGDSTGALVGIASGGIERCHADGTVSGGDKVGGLVGSGSGIVDCSADVAVTGNARVGGLVGSGGGITGSKAHGAVVGGDDVGGLLGHGADVSDSYATGPVTGGDRVAGLIGNSDYGEPLRCYATGAVSATGLSGGLGSWIMDHSRACFWDMEASGAAGSSGGKGLTTAQMQTPSVFGNAGWAGHGWVMNPGESPRREWEAAGAPPVPAAVPVPLAGSGTPGNPYLVGTAAELASLSWHAAVLDAHLRITGDIDCTGVALDPLGDLGPFTGVLDGGGFTISNATLDFPESDGVGLVGRLLEPGLVHDVRLAHADVRGRHNTGALVGGMTGRYETMADDLEWYPARVENCHAHGRVTGYISAGGLVGMAHTSEVTDSSGTVEVNGDFAIGGVVGYVAVSTLERCDGGGRVTGIDSVGGVAGELFGIDVFRNIPGVTYQLGKIANCRATAEVSGQDEVGGLLGHQWGDVVAGPGVLGCTATGAVSGRDRVGGLLGHNENQGIVADSRSTGNVNANDEVGGLVGRNDTGGDIRRSHSLGEVRGHTSVGGLVGHQQGSAIRRSFSRGKVIATASNAGGLLGRNEGSSLVSDCYAMGVVSGGFSGGLVGLNVASTVTNSYSTGRASGFTGVGGLVGYNVFGGAGGSYWDTVTSQLTVSAGGEARTTGQMIHPHDATTYVDWDFTETWAADSDATRNHGYPYLAGVTPPPALVTVAANPPSGGTATGGGAHPPGSATTVSASPAVHHHFVGWEREGEILSTQADFTFTVLGATDLTARFALDRHLITVTAEPADSGEVSGGAEYEHGEQVTVTATPAADRVFLRWMEGGTVVSEQAVYEFTASGPRDLVARFGLPVVFAGGSGTSADPYLVASALHLHNVRQVAGGHFRQAADIDLGVAPWNEGEGWEPIGRPENLWDYQPEEVFSGHYDGAGFAIRNLVINRPGQGSQGLFGVIDGGEIHRLTLENAVITADGDTGALAGLVNAGLVNDCHSSGAIRIGDWSHNAGGLIGILWPGGIVEHSSSSATVGGYGAIGGLIGQAAGTVRRSFATGAVTGSWYAGGFAGTLGGSFIENCFATGSVTDSGDMGSIGGFAGGERWLDVEMTVRHCYSTGTVVGGAESEAGGFVGVWGSEWDEPGEALAVIEGCYWDTGTSGQATSPAGEGRPTAAMIHPYAADTYVGWDFASVWAADTDGSANQGYPYLRAPGGTPTFTLTYLAGPGGTLVGETPQSIESGGIGSTLFAWADAGAEFHRWSDGSTANPRLDENVTSDLTVTAAFRSLGGVEIDWYAGHGIAPDAGQTWADLDRLDLTGKGMTLLDDFFAGTDPHDSRSRFAAEAPLAGPGGALTLRWSSVPGRSYGIDWSSDLAQWNEVEAAGGGPLRIEADSTETQTETTINPPATVDGAPVFLRIKTVP